MTDNSRNSRKAKKQSLLPGWIERSSKKYPDKCFYFNEKTGESRWSPPPSDSQSEVMNIEGKGKKRKVLDKETEESLCTSTTIDDHVNSTISVRPKLKIRKVKAHNNEQYEANNDTPAMRLYREKLAQRKLAFEAKKNTPKASIQKQNKMLSPPNVTSQVTSSSSSSQSQRRTRRTCSSLSNETASTSSNNFPNISIVDTKTEKTLPIVETCKRATRSLVHESVNKTGNISKLQPQKASLISSKSNASLRDTSVDTGVIKKNLVDTNNKRGSLRRSVTRNLSNDQTKSFRRSFNNKSIIDDNNIADSSMKSVETNSSNKQFKNISSNKRLLDDNTLSTPRKSMQKNLLNECQESLIKSSTDERFVNKHSPIRTLKKSPNNTYTSSKSASKNLANKRLQNYRNINNERDKRSTFFHQQLHMNNNIFNNSMLDKEINENNQESFNEEENIKNSRSLDEIEVANVHCEQMEWEPIEDEKIMSEVHSVRYQLCEKSAGVLNKFSCSALQSLDTSGEKHALYIIIDTNVFLSNLPFIEEIRDSHSDIFGRPFIVIPWTVLQELDFIKDSNNPTRSQVLKPKARKAVEFLNHHFTIKHPRFLGQTPMDVEKNRKKFVIECPDDEILQTCLQLKEAFKSPVLLSYDKNLCNKAMIHDIPILGRNDPLEKIYYLKAAETTEFLSNSLHTHIDKSEEDNGLVQKELLAAEDIMENGKAVLKAVFSAVVANEMKNLFGKRWENHVIIKPPWTIVDVLKCTLKHWIAAVSESFERRTESMIRNIYVCINEVPEGGRKLQDVNIFLDQCKNVIQTLNNAKYPSLKQQMLTQIDDLKQTCMNNIKEFNNVRLKESVGSEDDAGEEERRASLAFKVFEEIYAFARDTCGLSADAMGLQCSFSYNKLHPFLTTKIALEHQKDVGTNVNRLLQALRVTLSKLNEGTGLDNTIILSLYEELVNFSPDLNFKELKQVTPLDIYCCVKLKKATIENGYEQLQELAIHFCRMANHKYS